MPLPPLVEPADELSDSEKTRTARHRVLAGFGEDAQRRLAAAHVAVVGAGGLGSPAVLALAAAGVGTLTVIDDDVVEASNLQRQVMHRVSDVGSLKVDSAVRVGAELSPATVVRAVPQRITAENARHLLAGADVVIDGSDTFETRAAVATACAELGLPLVWGVVQEFHAQVTVFWSAPPAGVTPVLLEHLYPPDAVGDVPSCAQVGVLGALCLQVGGLLATEAIKLIAGVGEPLLGRVVVIDALRGRTDEVPLRPVRPSRVVEPAGQTSAALPTAHTSAAHTSAAPASAAPASPAPGGAPVPQLSPAEARSAHDAGTAFVDVREPWETAHGVIPDSMLVPLGDLLADPARAGTGPVVVVCQVGMRAQRAAVALRATGVEASVLAGGIEAWTRAGEPVTVPA